MLSGNRVDLGFVCFINFQFYPPPPQNVDRDINKVAKKEDDSAAFHDEYSNMAKKVMAQVSCAPKYCYIYNI